MAFADLFLSALELQHSPVALAFEDSEAPRYLLAATLLGDSYIILSLKIESVF